MMDVVPRAAQVVVTSIDNNPSVRSSASNQAGSQTTNAPDPIVSSVIVSLPDETRVITSVITESADTQSPAQTVVVTLTSSRSQTASVTSQPPVVTSLFTTTPTALVPSSTSGAQDSGSKPESSGLTAGAKTAIAVAVPVIVVALLVVFAIFWWRRRAANKSADDARRTEVEEYNYHPNTDPSFPEVAMVSRGGYRSWGNPTAAQQQGTALPISPTSDKSPYNQNGEGQTAYTGDDDFYGDQYAEKQTGSPPEHDYPERGLSDASRTSGAAAAGAAMTRAGATPAGGPDQFDNRPPSYLLPPGTVVSSPTYDNNYAPDGFQGQDTSYGPDGYHDPDGFDDREGYHQDGYTHDNGYGQPAGYGQANVRQTSQSGPGRSLASNF